MTSTNRKCRGYPFLECDAANSRECFNESCIRRDQCCSSVLVSAEGMVSCQLKPHDKQTKHLVEIKEHFGHTMVTITWPSRKDPFNA